MSLSTASSTAFARFNFQAGNQAGNIIMDGNTGIFRVRAGSTASGGLRLETGTATPLMLMTNSLERMRIDANGTVAMGTTSSAYSLIVQNGSLGNQFITDLTSANPGVELHGTTSASIVYMDFANSLAKDYDFRLQQNGNSFSIAASSTANQLVLNGNGFVGIGTSTPNTIFTVDGDAGNPTGPAAEIEISSTGTGKGLRITQPQFNCGGGCVAMQFYSYASNSVKGSITYNAGGGVDYNQTSDRRIKENFASSTYGLENLLQIDVEDFNYIGAATSARQTGFIAQNLAKIFPGAVTMNGDDGESLLHRFATSFLDRKLMKQSFP
jgi:hypothetical protein